MPFCPFAHRKFFPGRTAIVRERFGRVPIGPLPHGRGTVIASHVTEPRLLSQTRLLISAGDGNVTAKRDSQFTVEFSACSEQVLSKGFAMLLHRLLFPVVLVGCGSAFWSAFALAEEAPASRAVSAQISGREIFLREWLPNDPRSHGGDGLGPVFNETSCVACHNQGGVGGSGSEGKNVNVISALRLPNQAELQAIQQKAAAEAQAAQARGRQQAAGDLGEFVAQALEAGRKLGEPKEKPKPLTDEERKAQLAVLKELHPGLATTRSVVLHRSSIDANYSEWRQKLMLGAEMFDQMAMMAGAPQLASNSQGGAPQIASTGLFVLLQGLPPREMSVEKASSLTDTFMSHPTFRSQLGFRGQRDGKTPMFACLPFRSASETRRRCSEPA
ncbi:MAG: thiol oxidoreductase [Planctomycetota bacterium]|nr:MAG: thiol oxidoreductase [Planctomycetota bacterium]